MKPWVVAAVVAMIAVDVADTWLAATWADDRSRWWVLAVGVVTSTVIFVLFASLIAVADVWWVTVVWATVTVAGGAAIDRLARGVDFPGDVVAGLCVVLAIVGWLTWRMAQLTPPAT